VQADHLGRLTLVKVTAYGVQDLGVDGIERLATQADVIERVPAEHRGIFYAMAHLTLRNGEARALRSGDYDFRRRELFVGWAMESGAASSERKATKTDADAR